MLFRSEHSGREALHSAEAFEAFDATTDEGKCVADVAARFCVSAETTIRCISMLRGSTRQRSIESGRHPSPTAAGLGYFAPG